MGEWKWKCDSAATACMCTNTGSAVVILFKIEFGPLGIIAVGTSTGTALF
jgi:hypothetical protein